jgi:lipopolysaccharide cholinephosphotransferase
MAADEVKKVQLDLLRYLDATCRENHIEYSLIGGSLLGSVRHGGFIPWDDDIDIMLVRGEYEKLVAVLQRSPERYHLLHYTTDDTFQPYSKFYDTRTVLKSFRDQMYNKRVGVHVDVFPYDALPADSAERAAFMHEVFAESERLVSTVFPAFISGTTWYYQFARVFLRLPFFIRYHGKNREIAQKLDTLAQRYDSQSTLPALTSQGADSAGSATEMGFLGSRYFSKEHFPSGVFSEYEDCKFEDMTVRRIVRYDDYLTQIFGDYMQLPPVKDRVNHDFYHWFWKEGE